MILLDFETTGLTGPRPLPIDKQPCIIEATLAVLDDKSLKEINRYTTLIRPTRPISTEVTRITGLKDSDFVNCQSFANHYGKFCDMFLGQRIMVAHNCAFEATLIELELKRIGRLTQFPWPPRRICTVEASQHIKGHKLKLSELYALATNGKTIKGIHRTDVDVTMLVTSVRWLRKQGLISII